MISPDSYTEECQWTEVQQNFRMGKYSYYVTADNASECMKACEESTKINCVSVDYLPSLQRCFLSLYDRTDYKISAGNDYQYYERLCDGEYRFIHPRFGANWVMRLVGIVEHLTP